MLSVVAFELALASLAAAYVAGTIATSHLFDPVRLWLFKRWLFLARGISCGFCMSFWAAIAVIPFSGLQLTIINVLAVAALSAAFLKVTQSAQRPPDRPPAA